MKWVFQKYPLVLISLKATDQKSSTFRLILFNREERDHHLPRTARTCSGEERAVHPVIARVAGFEAGMGAHVVGRLRHLLAARDGGDHFGGAMAVAVVLDLDGGAVMGFEGVARIKLGHAAWPDRLPIRPEIEDAPRKPRAFDTAADDGDDPAMACAALAHFADRVEIDEEVADMVQDGGWKTRCHGGSD